MNTQIGAFEAKTHLSQLLDRVAQGERIAITRRGRPVAQLVPYEAGVDAGGLRRLVARVREERGAYGVKAGEIADWKSEGRR